MKSLDIDLEKIAADDCNSARQMAIATHDWTPRILAVVVICAWVFIQWHLLNSTIVSEMRELVARVLGTLDAALTLVLSYYFGAAHKHEEPPK